jgi:putative 4-mercaptohistidine N1-methyltranferase
VDVPTNIYESAELVSQYLNLHFASEEEVLSLPSSLQLQGALHFPQRCAQLLIEVAREHQVPLLRALDVGCAVGGASFALSTAYQEVVGVDLSQAFIDSAQRMQTCGRLTYQRKDQGSRTTTLQATLAPDTSPKRVRFLVGDACHLPEGLGLFDAVLMANLLCRVPEPRGCLEALWRTPLLQVGGLLALFSPYSWLPDYTARERWLGGTAAGPSEEEIPALLAPHLRLLREEPFPLIIREHERKFQLIISHATVWQRI